MQRNAPQVAKLASVVLIVVQAGACAGPARQLPPSTHPLLSFAPSPEALASRLSRIFAIKAISTPAEFDAKAFLALHELFAELYPTTHEHLEREVVADYSLLYRWQGSDPSLRPAVFIGHLDAAPLEAGDEARWTFPPFEARVAGGYLWARGVMHSRFVPFGLFEATEQLLAAGHQPRRTMYFAFGHDDDLLGNQGAAVIGRLLEARGVVAEFVLEEGGMLVGGDMSGFPFPIAQLAVAEKGYLTVWIEATGAPGHSSMAPERSAIEEVAEALSRIKRTEFEARITPPVEEMAAALAPELGGLEGFALANLWLTSAFLLEQLDRRPQTRALIRTTATTTMISGGVKDNVLPAAARATMNVRLLPGDTVAGVLAELRRRVDGLAVTVKPRPGFAVDPLPPSTADTEAFHIIAGSIRQVFPEVRVVPSLLTAVTDIRHYRRLTTNLYRFNPIWLREEDDVLRLHGVDERVAVADLAPAVVFYAALLRNAGG